MADEYKLREESFWFQEITVSEEEQAIIELMLEDAGWMKAEEFNNDHAVESLIDKGLIWWSIFIIKIWINHCCR